MNTDDDWEWYGRENPYFGVLAEDRYRGGHISDALWSEFFGTGQGDVDRVLATVDRHLAPMASMDKALDFGCGVGRFAIPLARRFKSVVGVDVSESMLGEAQRNAQRLQAGNLRWCRSLSELAGESRSFSFVNTLIVLQHIAPERGLGLIEGIVDLLASGGCGAIQLTYGRARHQRELGQQALIPRSLGRIRQRYVAIGRRLSRRAPGMQMNAYPLNKVMFLLQARGVTRFFAEFSDHGGHLGITIYFRLP